MLMLSSSFIFQPFLLAKLWSPLWKASLPCETALIGYVKEGKRISGLNQVFRLKRRMLAGR